MIDCLVGWLVGESLIGFILLIFFVVVLFCFVLFRLVDQSSYSVRNSPLEGCELFSLYIIVSERNRGLFTCLGLAPTEPLCDSLCQ